MSTILKILHLEDELSDADMVSYALKKSGIDHRLLHTDNKIDFTRALHVFSPDIILSDHSLPSFNSHEALQIVKDSGKIIPFILVTATVSEEYAVSIIKDGAADYILKDRLQRLPSAVINALEKVKVDKELVEQKIQQEKLLMEKGLQAQEKERNEIGQELHDNINQVLAAAKLYLQTAIHKTKSYPGGELLEKSHEYILLAIGEIRKLSHTLITPSLNVITLSGAVSDMIEDIRQTTSLKIQLLNSTLAEQYLNENTSLMFFRIIQEQINNILKHAQAQHATINFKLELNALVLMISDDGVGFDTRNTGGGIGLRNISNRAAYYDGTVEIISAPGKGCLLEVRLPVKKDQATWLQAV